MLKTFGQLFENYSVTAEGALFSTRKEMEDACLAFIKKNASFAKKVYIPAEGHGASENDFVNGVCKMKIQMKSSSNYKWNHNIKPNGLLDVSFRLQKAKAKMEDGDQMMITVFNGTDKMNLVPGLIVMSAAGHHYVVGNIKDAAYSRQGLDLMYKDVQASDDDRMFLTLAGQQFGQIYDKDIIKHGKEFSKILSK